MDAQTPNPTSLDSQVCDLRPQDAARNLFCRNYDACLSVVVKNKWDDWSCARCELRGRDQAPRAASIAQSRPYTR